MEGKPMSNAPTPDYRATLRACIAAGARRHEDIEASEWPCIVADYVAYVGIVEALADALEPDDDDQIRRLLASSRPSDVATDGPTYVLGRLIRSRLVTWAGDAVRHEFAQLVEDESEHGLSLHREDAGDAARKAAMEGVA